MFGLKPVKPRWPMHYRLGVAICATIPLFFGLAWLHTFGFTDYRAHLAPYGIMLGLACVILAVGMFRMRRWAIWTSLVLTTLVVIGCVWLAAWGCGTGFWLIAGVGCLYLVIFSKQILKGDRTSGCIEPAQSSGR